MSHHKLGHKKSSCKEKSCHKDKACGDNCCQGKIPICNEPCVSNDDQTIPCGVIHLTNKDFISGTYRIKRSATYVLDEDIVFFPSPKLSLERPDFPRDGAWIAAMSVEVGNVIIEGNGHKLRLSTEWVENINNAPVGFSLLILGNTLFPPTTQSILVDIQSLEKVGFDDIFAFAGETDFIVPHNLTVRNVSFENSSHFGISGNGETGILIENCRFYDNQVAGMFIGGSQTTVRNCNIIGRTSGQIVSSRNAQLTAFPHRLARLVQEGINPEQSYQLLQEFQTYLEANPNTVNIVPLMEVPTYGMRIKEITASSAPPSYGILIENVTVTDINSAPRTVPVLGILCGVTSLGLPPPLNSVIPAAVPIRDGGAFGLLEWSDFFDASGNFAPNVVAKTGIWLIANNATGELPQEFINSVLCTPPNAEVFAAYARPLLTHVGEFLQTGCIGIRVDVATQATIRGCTVSQVYNHGAPILPLQQYPANYYPPWDPAAPGQKYPINDSNLISLYAGNPYRGNDAWGIKCEGNGGFQVENCTVVGVYSDHGNSFGISSTTGLSITTLPSNGNIVKDCFTENISTNWENLPGDFPWLAPTNPNGAPYLYSTQFVSPSGLATGYITIPLAYDTIIDYPLLLDGVLTSPPAVNINNNNSFIRSVSQQITSPRNSYGFFINDFNSSLVEGCTIGDIITTSTNNTDACNPKTAIGINVISAIAEFANLPIYERGTRVIDNTISNVHALNESEPTGFGNLVEKLKEFGAKMKPREIRNELKKSGLTLPTSVTAGIQLFLASACIVEKNKINNIDGGFSSAFGIVLEGSTQIKVKKNYISDVNNFAFLGGIPIPVLYQYGIIDFAAYSNSLFVANVVEDSGTNALFGGNYSANLASGTLQVNALTYGDFGAFDQYYNKYYNVSFTGTPLASILPGEYCGQPLPNPPFPPDTYFPFPCSTIAPPICPVFNYEDPNPLPCLSCIYPNSGCQQGPPQGCAPVYLPPNVPCTQLIPPDGSSKTPQQNSCNSCSTRQIVKGNFNLQHLRSRYENWLQRRPPRESQQQIPQQNQQQNQQQIPQQTQQQQQQAQQQNVRDQLKSIQQNRVQARIKLGQVKSKAAKK